MFDMYIINALFLFLLQTPSRKATVLWLQLIPNKKSVTGGAISSQNGC